MKVNIAAQSFSSGVADALYYCNHELKLSQFEGSDPTIQFIRMIDHLFDILNSRTPFSKGYKAPLKVENKSSWKPFLDEAYVYLSNITTTTKQPILSSNRKTGFVGFLAAIKSAQSLFTELVEKDDPLLKYLLMYKFSQDHLELFFGAVRSCGGFNNNPTASQFTASYKRLLMRSNIKGRNGNCLEDPTEILHVTNDEANSSTLRLSDAALIRKYDLVPRQPEQSEHDYCDVPNFGLLSEFKKAAVSYIAGYVGKMTHKQLICETCSNALGSTTHYHTSQFLKLKDRGGLFKPSHSLLRTCEETEKCFNRLLSVTNGKCPTSAGITQAISVAVLGNINHRFIFSELNEHMKECAVEDNHLTNLIKLIARNYCKIRMHHLTKEDNARMSGPKIRKKLSKLILFNHQ